MLQRKHYFNEIKHIFILFIEVFKPNHSNIKWLINRPCGTELVNLSNIFVFKILSKSSILTLIKGRHSIANLPKIQLIQAFMHVLVTCKNQEDQVENEGARLCTGFLPWGFLLYGDFSRRSRAANSAVHGTI